MYAWGIALAVSRSGVQHSPEMLLTEQALSPGAVGMVVPRAAGGELSQQAVHGAVQLALTKLASHCRWQTARKLLVLLFFVHAARQVSKYTGRAQEELR